MVGFPALVAPDLKGSLVPLERRVTALRGRLPLLVEGEPSVCRDPRAGPAGAELQCSRLAWSMLSPARKKPKAMALEHVFSNVALALVTEL